MAVKINQKHSKEIVALNTFEAVRLRPTMYLGQVALMDEKIPIIEKGKIIQKEKNWSPGFMHLIVEILENALDEAKRMKGKMKKIEITIDLRDNEITVQDTGGGFHKATSIHSKTNKSIVRTAFEELHAGSNFIDSSTNILGTHGVGSAIVNILSEKFTVHTTNATTWVKCEWKDFKIQSEKKGTPGKTTQRGTKVSFVPSTEVFPGFKWDLELIQTYLSFKQFLIQSDPKISKTKLVANVINLDGENNPLELFENFIPEEHILVQDKEWGTMIMWESFQDSTSIGFINGSQATGIHQKIVNDWCNEHFDYNLAHHFFETLVSLSIPSTMMRFADQNKTKYAGSRWEIEPEIEPRFKNTLLRRLKGSTLEKKIKKEIESRLYNENIREIRKVQRSSKRKISEKYTAASKIKESLYIAEGQSAAGGVKQSRNSEREGVYALKGKIKNTRNLSDLTTNKEILEIMSILGIEPGSKKPPSYKNIVIAADEDPDGQHITALVINFFNKWFPYIIEEGRLQRLITPLVAADHGRKRVYFFTSEEFAKYNQKYKLTNVSYLKGLGSLSIDDWDFVMDNKLLFGLSLDEGSEESLEIAFGSSSQKRKLWLEGK